MANYATAFSFAIELKTDEEKEWAKAACELVRTITNDMDEETPIPEVMKDIFPDGYDGYYIGYVAEIDTDGDLWIYEEEAGEPNNAADLVQAFLKKFTPDQMVWFSWANTCSRPILDSFGGGSVVVTATDQHWMSSAQWGAETMKFLARKKSIQQVSDVRDKILKEQQ